MTTKELEIEKKITKNLSTLILSSGDDHLWEITKTVDIFEVPDVKDYVSIIYAANLINGKILHSAIDMDFSDCSKYAEQIYNKILQKLKSYKNTKRLIELVAESGKEAAELYDKNYRQKRKISWIKRLLRDPIESEMGSCHSVWNIQQKILWEKHKLDWLTPAERFPDAKFD